MSEVLQSIWLVYRVSGCSRADRPRSVDATLNQKSSSPVSAGYFWFSLRMRNVEELMAERGLIVDHTTVWRWCQKYGPVVYQRLKGKVKYKTTTWHMDETYVRVAGG